MDGQITVRELTAPEDISRFLPPEKTTQPYSPDLLRQLWRLENRFLQEIGEPLLDGEKRERLAAAIRERRVMFFPARQGCSAGDVGMYRALGFETELGTMLACLPGRA